MRDRETIENAADSENFHRWDEEHAQAIKLCLEVLLDIRSLLAAPNRDNPWTCPKCGGVGTLPTKPGNYVPTCDQCLGAGRIIPSQTP